MQMNPNFNKINLNLKNIDYNQFKSNRLMKEFNYGNGVFLRFFHINNMEYFKSCHITNPFILLPYEVRYGEIEGPGNVRPHIDHRRSVALNYYFESGNCITRTYSLKENALMLAEKHNDGLSHNIYRDEDLIENGSFVAEDGDAYLLNVSKIHSVECPGQKIRKFISYSWDYRNTFKEIYNGLIDYAI